MTHTAVTFLQRLQVGDIGPADARILADVASGMLGGKTAEEVLNLAPGWAEARARRERDRLLATSASSQSAWAEARARREQLLEYLPRYPDDRRLGSALRPEDAGSYRLMTIFKYVPSADALRKAKKRATT